MRYSFCTTFGLALMGCGVVALFADGFIGYAFPWASIVGLYLFAFRAPQEDF